MGIEVNCVDGTGLEEYGGELPLSDISQWAIENGYGWQYFNATGTQAEDIVNFMNDNPDTRFILVGHSAGAAAIVQAASLFTEAGSDGASSDKVDNISGIIVLDMLLSKDIGQPEIDILIESDIAFKSYNSMHYELYQLTPSFDIPKGSDMIWGSPFSEGHYALAVDQALFENKIIPSLYNWTQ